MEVDIFIVSDNFLVNKFCNESFLISEILKFNACVEPRVGISTQDGRMGYLSLILYLREGTSPFSSPVTFGGQCVCGGGGRLGQRTSKCACLVVPSRSRDVSN